MTVENTHQHTCNVVWDGRPHNPAFGCRCECGATYHYLGWQEITTLPEPENPCAVVYEEQGPEYSYEFDIEAYRADLQRRFRSLVEAAERARDRETYPFLTSNRLANKALGIDIALDLLPRRLR